MTPRAAASAPEPARPPGDHRPLVGVVLAAGKGTRMHSELPKVLHPVAGRPMLAWVLDAVRAAGCGRILVVVGHGAGRVRETVAGDDLEWVLQEEQLGTGHAVAQAAGRVAGEALLLVASGDVPLVSPTTLERLVAAAHGAWGALAVATLDDPASLGRVTARGDGALGRIVEAADATPDELAVRRINAGLYALPAPDLFRRIAALEPDNVKGEIYLTDALSAAAADGERVALVELDDPAEAAGANDRRELARLHRRLLARRAEELLDAGVSVLDPARTAVEPGVEVAADSVIHPGVTLLGRTVVGAGCVLHQGAWLRDARIGAGVEILPYSVLDGVRVADGCRVGPFARLRPGAELAEGVRVGNFVEVKNARLGAGAKAGHLAYLGDAEVGAGSNIGAGVVTCNYDGENKHRTEIGRNAFIGSDTMLVAPVRVGDGATTGAGSAISHDVPERALAVERGRQRTIPDWEERRRERRSAREEEE